MKCAVYIRLSNANLVREISYHYQNEMLFKYIQEKGWEIYQCYVDAQLSSMKAGASLLQMIRDAEENKFDIILVKKSSLLV